MFYKNPAPEELLIWMMSMSITFNSPKSSKSAVLILKCIHILCIWDIYSSGTEGQVRYCEWMYRMLLEICNKLPRLSFSSKNRADMQNSERHRKGNWYSLIRNEVTCHKTCCGTYTYLLCKKYSGNTKLSAISFTISHMPSTFLIIFIAL